MATKSQTPSRHRAPPPRASNAYTTAKDATIDLSPLDTTFDTDGELTIDTSSVEIGNALYIGPDYKITVAGRTGTNGATYDFALARIKVASNLEERTYAETDVNHNVTSVSDTFGAVKERFVYDPYGAATVLTSAYAATSDSLNFVYRDQGLRYDLISNTNDNRDRVYLIALGRSAQADNAGYIDGANRYQRELSSPIVLGDPSGDKAWDYKNDWDEKWVAKYRKWVQEKAKTYIGRDDMENCAFLAAQLLIVAKENDLPVTFNTDEGPISSVSKQWSNKKELEDFIKHSTFLEPNMLANIQVTQNSWNAKLGNTDVVQPEDVQPGDIWNKAAWTGKDGHTGVVAQTYDDGQPSAGQVDSGGGKLNKKSGLNDANAGRDKKENIYNEHTAKGKRYDVIDMVGGEITMTYNCGVVNNVTFKDGYRFHAWSNNVRRKYTQDEIDKLPIIKARK